ncbi:CDP-alcohol phosphatidyltransferase family protein [Corynebacterium sp. TAE3-ERU12]|uniref:phosphatidylinositol phosphate synthase n=1 Tax=Corynebacterium sp. TAE3-ERU12 TaxID=2849491 RepID=UPI001C43C1AE|nr:CDP-alcohol phosphatidyltransferase family protein [Corynebacterium sp. TAE3-ERU12]MBV7295346.1 CDP-alcohol phosphatidyltransferase family protein [Corynebacterium sp. TAE3-ERU12]
MLSAKGRKPVRGLIEPLAKTATAAGLSPNAVTVIGTLAAIAISVSLIPTGHLFLAAVLAGLFTAFDMVDGTMARLRGGGTRFGAVLDASCDRITDGALFLSILWWLIYSHDAPWWLLMACMVVIVGSQVTSYVKARAEASGFHVDGGLVERPERLIIGLVGVGFEGLGVPYAIEVSLSVLAIGSVITVVQRLMMVAQDERGSEHIAPPAGAEQ